MDVHLDQAKLKKWLRSKAYLISHRAAELPQGAGRVRRYALIALAVLAVEEIVGSAVFLMLGRNEALRHTVLLPASAFATHWGLPILVVYLIEKRGIRSLGLTMRRSRAAVYSAYLLAALVLPAVVLGLDRALLRELVEQMVYIGLAEEVFFRGYLLRRLADWLGERGGLVLSAAIFGLAHITSRLSQHGLSFPWQDLALGARTFLGGLLFGYIYLRSRSIIPGAILHVSTNMYLGKALRLLSLIGDG